jgi:hypothetical protein
MKEVTIDLAGSFEKIVADLRSVPPTDDLSHRRNNSDWELSPEVQEVVRSIYEAARGRQFATTIGLVPAGPAPIAPFLKDAPFEVGSQADFLLQALGRLYRGSRFKAESPSEGIKREVCNPTARDEANPSSHRQQKSFSTQITYDHNHDKPAYSHYHASPKSKRVSAPVCAQENHAGNALRE